MGSRATRRHLQRRAPCAAPPRSRRARSACPGEWHVGAPSGAARFSVRIDRRGAHARVTVSGDVDLAAVPFLHFVLCHALRTAPAGVTLDLHGVPFIDCRGVRCVLGAQAWADRHGRAFEVEGVRPLVGRTFVLCNLAAAFAAEGS